MAKTKSKAMSPKDSAALARAFELLEHPGFFIRVVDIVGMPVEYGLKKLPQKAQKVINTATVGSLKAGLKVAVTTLDPKHHGSSSNWFHGTLVAATGAAGGFFGLMGLPIELPISTGVMLRSIADIARSEGEDLNEVQARLACLEVFALGGSSPHDDAAETSYYLVRTALARALSEAAEFIVEKGIVEEGAPAIVRLLASIASRFEIQVSEKVTLEMIPIIGAAGGAIINLCFINHFQDMARGHFTVRRLERKYGDKLVKLKYNRLGKAATKSSDK
jgi:hypothetical protein